jgi:DNA mismatch repair protein MutL
LSIQILPPILANQIAAGEVVERPASIVKECVENSIDAGATLIEIVIEKGGHKRIVIKDNGKGIPKDELQLALARHATSKIRDIDDLQRIMSLGFRGEALASISSVSRLRLSSKPQGQEQAWLVYSEGREQTVRFEPVAHPKGSTVDIQDLFYNTPARRKFLKAEKTEFSHIDELIKRIALSKPEIGFKLVHNHKTVRHFPAVKEVVRRIDGVCGKTFSQECVVLDTAYGNITVQAWLTKPLHHRSTNDLQYTFVNGRMMRDKLINHAIKQAYEGLISPQSYPGYVVFVQVPAAEVDVNVHPAKHEVRFVQARTVHDFIYQAVSDALQAGFTDAATINYDQIEVDHDYISPLQTVSAADNTSAGSSVSSSGSLEAGYSGSGPAQPFNRYQTERPSGKALGNYAELLTDPQGQVNEPQSSTTNILDGCGVGLLLPSADVIFATTPLTVCSANIVVYEFLKRQASSSETAQPLLLPVAQSLQEKRLGKLPWSELLEQHFLVEVIQQKCIIKKVPSLLRQLPWNLILPQWLTVLAETQMDSTKWSADYLVQILAESCVQKPTILNTILVQISTWLVQDKDFSSQELHRQAKPISWEFTDEK